MVTTGSWYKTCASEINDGARPVANKGARPEIINADVRCICTKTSVGDFGVSARPREQEIGRPRRRTRKNRGPCEMSRLTGFGAPLRGRCVAEDAGRKKASQQQQQEVGEMRPNVRQTGCQSATGLCSPCTCPIG